MKQLVFIIWMVAALTACETMGPIISDLQKQEADCKAAGGAYVLGKGCVMPNPDNPDPGIPVPPQPNPGPTPEPNPPTPDNLNWQTLNPGESIEFDPKELIVFYTRGIDSRIQTSKEWHIFDADGTIAGNLSTNAHIMLFWEGCDIRMIHQKYNPVVEQQIKDDQCFNPAKIYRWEIAMDFYSFALTIGEMGMPPRVSMPAEGRINWDSPFTQINRMRIGAGTFGFPYVPAAPIEFAVVK